jgi:hypothetical protein
MDHQYMSLEKRLAHELNSSIRFSPIDLLAAFVLIPESAAHWIRPHGREMRDIFDRAPGDQRMRSSIGSRWDDY